MSFILSLLWKLPEGWHRWAGLTFGKVIVKHTEHATRKVYYSLDDTTNHATLEKEVR